MRGVGGAGGKGGKKKHKGLPRASIFSWCDACVRTSGVNPSTVERHIAANLQAMNPFDTIALVFTAFIVAVTVVGELKDIHLCTLLRKRNNDSLSSGWRFALSFLGGVRQWVFLPVLVSVVPTLVALKGGDALSICFNTVAVLFLCEIDNLAYMFGFSERMRTRVEDAGRLELTEGEARALARTKPVHAALIMSSVLLCVILMTSISWTLR
eukprot:COSAG05_NODE_3488_length_2030_cov_3.309684_2_plen_211_part_00